MKHQLITQCFYYHVFNEMKSQTVGNKQRVYLPQLQCRPIFGLTTKAKTSVAKVHKARKFICHFDFQTFSA